MMIAKTPVEAWIREKTGIGPGPAGSSFLQALHDYQLKKLNEVIEYARGASPFYSRRLASQAPMPLASLSDIAGVPFTFPSDIAANPYGFLAVRQDDVARIVTLRTSGSTGEAKRLFFSGEDLELTVDFFHRGMATMVRPGQKVAILLPGERPDSVGDLLARGLRRMGVEPLVLGPVTEPLEAARAIASFGARCLVGIPTQVLAVARSQAGAAFGRGGIESVLLSTDYVPRSIAETLEEAWGCRVFTHYGMTEMGLGGGVECEALDGYHLREADLYFEVVDRETGGPCSPGALGEVVFTTLTRRGMPLIRYRTGDIARIIPEPCACGSALRRMARVRGRRDGDVPLGLASILTLSDMDEALFGLPGLLDYRATVSKGRDGTFRLHLDVHRSENNGPTERDILRVLDEMEALRSARAGACLETPTVGFSEDGRWTTTGVAKRRIIVKADPGV